MKVQELIDQLTALVERNAEVGGAEVLFASQPSYPLQCTIAGPVVSITDDAKYVAASDDEESDDGLRAVEDYEGEDVAFVYLAEGHTRWAAGQEITPYAAREIWAHT